MKSEPRRVCRRLQLISWMEHHDKADEYSPEVRERAAPMGQEGRGVIPPKISGVQK